jgi:hypothetical protein
MVYGKADLEALNKQIQKQKPLWEKLYDYPFRCGVCADRFHTKKELKLHKEKQHAI